jgi:hypothetical protein
LLYKKTSVAKSKEVKTGCNLAEFSKEDYGSKRAVLPVMNIIVAIIIIIIVISLLSKCTSVQAIFFWVVTPCNVDGYQLRTCKWRQHVLRNIGVTTQKTEYKCTTS